MKQIKILELTRSRLIYFTAIFASIILCVSFKMELKQADLTAESLNKLLNQQHRKLDSLVHRTSYNDSLAEQIYRANEQVMN